MAAELMVEKTINLRSNSLSHTGQPPLSYTGQPVTSAKVCNNNYGNNRYNHLRIINTGMYIFRFRECP